MTVIAIALAILVSPAAVLAQGHEHPAEEGEALGHVTFPTSCRPEAQREFERGVALLHSFWYERANETFREVVTLDSSCAMGYWGQAMSLFHPLWTPPLPADLAAGLAAAERGVAVAQTARERDYVAAIRAYYADYPSVEHATRLATYSRAMDSVQRRHPRDAEAKIFYALSLIALGLAHPTDTTFAYHKRADALLEPLFRREPRHPGLAHYLIHGNDVPHLASYGLYAARRYAAIAPDVPHAQHMPSHIFTRLGLWDDDIASNVKSATAARRFEQERHLDALWDQRGHAWDYMIYAYLQQGRDSDAKRIVDDAALVTAGYPAGSLTNEYALAAIPARYALERAQWTEAVRLVVRPAPEWPATEAISHFARALGAARSGDTALASGEVAELARIEAAEMQTGGVHADWGALVGIQRLAATAWLTRAAGDTTEAVRLATVAADREDNTLKQPVTPGAVLPARELLGDLLLELGRPVEAARAYAQSLAAQPNRARSLFGAARAAELAGDREAARTRYREFLALMKRADGGRPELQAARAFLAAAN